MTSRRGSAILSKIRLKSTAAFLLCSAVAGHAYAQLDPTADSPAAINQAYEFAKKQALSGHHYEAAANFFNVYTAQGEHQNSALAFLTENLALAKFPNAASYFFIKTLQSGDHAVIRYVLKYLPQLMDSVGGDLLRPYILRHTTEEDYDADTRNHFNYFLGKDALLKGDSKQALAALTKVTSGSGILAESSYLRGTAFAILGQSDSAIVSFEACKRRAPNTKAGEDLEARCLAGLARTYYQKGDYEKAEETYDDIPKSSFVWTDILFEQAWTAYAKGDYNRALGKLVSYRSPSLSFVFNPEVEVLRAQSFYALCVFDDVNKTVNEFNSRYAGVGSQLKNFLLSHGSDLGAFYGLARQAYYRKLHTEDMLSKALNRFIRGPYFASLLSQERAIEREWSRAKDIEARNQHAKFAAFLEKVVAWRSRTVRMLGGMFVHNAMYDQYQDLLANLDKMSFVKLEMLKLTKQQLETKKEVMSTDEEGVMKRGKSDIDRKDYQYFWTFNGEFWIDELGDYVFALESQCGS